MALIWTAVAVISCVLLSTVHSQSNICYEQADILFILDASSSVGTSEFQKQLQFAATFVNNFQVGLTQFSVITIDSIPSLVFDFNASADNTAVKNAILNIGYTGGGTNTGAALRLAREQAFTPSRGARTGVPRIVIVSTDGGSNVPNETTVEAVNLKNTNVLVMSIGVGRSFNKTELDIIATHPEDVFQVVDYGQLVSIVYDYSEMICEGVQHFTCSNQADIFFLLDSSRTIPQDYYKSEQNFAIALSAKFDLKETRIGAATFGGNVLQTVITLGQFTSQLPLSQVLQAAIYLGGTTDTDSALKSVINRRLFDPASGGRPSATKILIILTDGGSVSAAQAKLTANQLRLTGVNIITVGVSNPNIAELQGLVTHSVLDLVTNLVNPVVAFDRILTLSSLDICTPPTIPFRDVSDYCRKNNLDNGIHPHPFDCTKFIECTFLRTDIMPCPPNEVYDPIIQTCTYPDSANPCNIFNTPNITMPPPVVTYPPTTQKPCIKGLLDILYILDSSDNVSRTDFRKELGDAANLPENFNIGPDAIQLGALSFGAVPLSLVNFNDFTDYRLFQHAILNAYYQGGSSNTFLALEAALQIFTSGNGSRVTAPKLAIVFTSGRSANSGLTQQAAAALKNAGVHIISVGYSNPDRQELEAIASSPSEVFINDYNGLVASIRGYSNTTCAIDDVCRGIQFSDVIFVLDSSKSIIDDEYRGQLNFVVDVTNKFTLGVNDTRFGAVIFSETTEKLFDLNAFDSMAALNSAILSAQHLKSGTDTAKAINFVREQQMFSVAAGARVNATQIVVVMTDGRSNSENDTVNAALRLKLTGVKFIAIGIGSEVNNEELEQLASDAHSLFLVPGFEALTEIQAAVSRKVCDLPKDDVNVPHDTSLCSVNSWADGIHPNPSDCSTFVICQSFQTTYNSCRPGEAYDAPTGKCMDPVTAHPCNDSNYFGPVVTSVPEVTRSTTKGPTFVEVTTLCKTFDLIDGIYPNPQNCAGFVECTAHLTQTLQCPDGLHFNTANRVCDDVHVVDCQVNYHYFDSP